MRPSMKTLYREHNALRSVARVLTMEVEMLQWGQRADMAVLHSILDYIESFPNRIHHPKEEDYLFRAMREVDSVRCGPVLDRLLHDHTMEEQSVLELRNSLNQLEVDESGTKRVFIELAGNYATRLIRHIEIENKQAFPLAEELLSEAHWDLIDQAFFSNRDPLSEGNDQNGRFARLHRKILSLATPLVGTRS